MTTPQVDSPAFLELHHLCHRYGDKQALDDVSLVVRKSEIVALLGPSGSGKSTLLNAIAGIVKPTAGRIIVDGRDLSQLPPESRQLGMVFQDYALWPHMTVGENVAFPLRVRKQLPRQEINARVTKALERLGLEDFAARRPQQLSGGQQQRVALARAVVAETRLLLLDEPLSALDPATRSSVRGELAEILRKLDLTTIIVTHDRDEAFELADRVAVLVDGKIQQYATPQEVYECPSNLAVARFMGANVLPIQSLGGGQTCISGSEFKLDLPHAPNGGVGYAVIVPERTSIADSAAGMTNVVPARLLRAQYRGGEYRLQARIGDSEYAQVIEARSKQAPPLDSLFVHLPVEAIHVIAHALADNVPAPLSLAVEIEKLPLFEEKLA